MKRMMLFVGAFMAAVVCSSVWAESAGCRLTKRAIDGIEQVTIENKYVALTFVPSMGGICTEFRDKIAGASWTTQSVKGEGNATFEDHVWQQKYAGDWVKGVYILTVLEDTPEKVSIQLRGQGAGDYNFDCFKKIITLTRDSSAVRAHYAYEVGHDAMSAKTRGLWFHHVIMAPGNKITYYYPLAEGVKTLKYDPALPPEEYWEYNPVKGWIGALAENGAGLGVRMDYQYIMCFYQWFGQSLGTLEWMFRNMTIPNGKSLETDIVFIPFQGLKNVSGVGAGAVIALDIPSEAKANEKIALKARTVAANPLAAGKAVWSARKYPDLLWKETGAGSEVKTAEAKAIDLTGDWTPSEDGLYAVRLQVLSGTNILAEAEAPVKVGKSDQKYVLAPECERLGSADDRFGKLAYKAEDVEIPWRNDVVTPHVPWGKPYARGPVKALFLMHYHNSREIIELAQRMDISFDAPLIEYLSGQWDSSLAYVGDVTGKMSGIIIQDLLKKYLQKDGYDVIVISGISWNALDKELPGLLAKQAEKGVGIVYITPKNITADPLWSFLPIDTNKVVHTSGEHWRATNENFITMGVPVEFLPKVAAIGRTAAPDAKTFLVNQGKEDTPVGIMREENGRRAVVFNYCVSRAGGVGWGDTLTPYIRYPRERFHYWEYHFSMLAKAILWAARREADVQLNISAAVPEFGAKSITAKVKVDGAGASNLGNCTVECVLRDEYWNEVARQELALSPKSGKSEAEFKAEKSLPAGVYFLDVILRCQGKSVNWGTAAFETKAPSLIASFELPVIKGKPFGSDFLKTGDTVAPVAVLAKAKKGMTIEGRLRDNLGRLIALTNVAVESDGDVSIPVPFKIDRPAGTEGFIEIALKEGDTVYDRADVDFVTLPDHFVSREWNDYEFMPWGALGGYNQGYLIPFAAKQVHSAGISMLYPNVNWTDSDDLRNEHESSLRAGFHLVEYGLWQGYPNHYDEDLKNYQKTKDKKYLERDPSLSDKSYRTNMTAEVRKKAELFKAVYPMAWIIGDEQSVIGRIPALDYDFSPAALRDFRQWLAKEYGSLEALNREWRRNYKTWDEATPLTGSEAKDEGNFAPWSDHRAFMEYSYAGFFEMLTGEIEKVAPNARTGLCGTQAASAYNGCDWARLLKIFKVLVPYYYNGQEEVIPCVNPSIIKAAWPTGYGSLETQLAGVWMCFLRGDRGACFFCLASFLNPDYTLTRSAQFARDATEPMRKGLGRLWSAVSADYDKIAVLHSQRSIHGAQLLGRECWRSHRGWFSAFYDMGYNPNIITPEQIENGELTPGKWSALVLPMTTSISEKQAGNIKDYVKAGGVVMADMRVGVMDGHCQPVAEGMLDSIFGITRKDYKKDGPSGAIVLGKDDKLGLDLSGISTETMLPEGDISLNGGTALGAVGDTYVSSVPCVIVNKVGKGKAIYLNLDIAKYGGMRGTIAGGFYLETVRKLTAWAGLAPAFQVEKPALEKTVLSDSFHLYRQKEGDNLYIGCVRNFGKKREWKSIKLPGKKHVYESQTGKYIGYTDTLTAGDGKEVADFFALLANRVKALKFSEAKMQARRGERVAVALAVETEGGKPGRHAAHVIVSDPDGKEAGHYSGNIMLVDGKGAFEIPFALNDRAGRWKIAARDAATGEKASAIIELQ